MKKLFGFLFALALSVALSLSLSAQDEKGVKHSHTDLSTGGCVDIYTYSDGRQKTVTTSPCTLCATTGICRYCGGAGQTFVAAGMFSRFVPCTLCGMTGRCRMCGGNGAVSLESWSYVSPSLGSGSYSTAPSVGGGGGSSYSPSTSSSKEWHSCHSCMGSGRCSNCHGTGRYEYSPNGRCGVCRGTGKCPGCDGKGGWSY